MCFGIQAQFEEPEMPCGIHKYFGVLPCLPDLRQGSSCRKASCDGWPKQDHLVIVRK